MAEAADRPDRAGEGKAQQRAGGMEAASIVIADSGQDVPENATRGRIGSELERHCVQLEAMVRERTRELEAANARLQVEIDRRRRAEEALREAAIAPRLEESMRRASAYNRSLIEASPDPLVTIDACGRITDVNAATEAATGRSRAELIGTDFSVYFTDPEKARAGYQQAFRDGSVRDYPLEICGRDGQRTPVLYNASVYRDEDGRVIGVFAAARDITALRRAEAIVRTERRRLHDILEMLPVYLLLLTPDYHVTFVNRFFRERFGEPRGRRCYEYLFGRRAPCESCETYTVLKTIAPHEWEWTGPDGRNYHIFDFPFTETDGTMLVLEIGIDITEHKRAKIELEKHRDRLEELVRERTRELEAANAQLQAEIAERKQAEEALQTKRGELTAAYEELQAHQEQLLALNHELQVQTRELNAAYQELREADRRKNEFLAMLSHELRNPLASIQNSLAILNRAAPGGEQARQAKAIIDRQVGQLARLVDDLLDITRVTQNKIQLQLEQIELNELVRRTIEDHRPLFEKNGVRLEAGYAPSAVVVRADKTRLAQVVGNLLQNAAKFTDRGGSARVSVGCDAAGRRAVIRVADTGIGMSPEVLEQVFQPFVQADTTLDRSRGGLGLGLALCKGLIELHGGDVAAYSDGAGRGSEFTVRLPLVEAAYEEPRPQAAPPEGFRRRRVLIIEDNVDLAESLRELLELDGHEAAVAYGGVEGLAKAREFLPEIVLCDIGLPGMDGYAVAEAFRADAQLKTMYLVALSGYAQPEDLKRAVEAGFDRHVAKPPDFDALDRMLRQAP